MLFRQLFDAETSTYTYLLADEQSREAVIIDSVRDQVERDSALITELGLHLKYALETHVHADHITGSGTLARRFGCRTVVGARAGARCADVAVSEGDRIHFGRYHLEVLETPGHTDGCLSFATDDHGMVFTGDALLIRGSGRTDFQQGDAGKLYHSITQKLFSLPDATLVYPGHDYKGRTVSSIGEEKAHNPRVGGGKSETAFAQIMAGLALPPPRKIAEAVPANMACGLPQADGPEVPEGPAWAPLSLGPDGVFEVDAFWLLTHADEVTVLDVREPDEWYGELSALGAAHRIPVATVAAGVASWDREAPVVTICRSGRRSVAAARVLADMGFRRVASLRGGMMAVAEARRGGGAAAA